MSFWRRGRGREAVEQPFPEAWRTRLADRWPTWRSLSADEQARLEQLTLQFIDEVRFEAARGFTVTDEMRLLVAAQASLLVLELPGRPYRKVSSVIVHPRTVVLQGARRVGDSGLVADDPYPISGQAHPGGPVVLAWSTLAFEARHPERGQNVVFHEFAHQLDMLDGTTDGTPPIADADQRARWIEVCTSEYRALRRGADHVLRPYAATDPGEFFAVATEQFFSNPVPLREGTPALYEALVGFYLQDPAARVSG
jgi:Mlc titration factor MtfA (ptsG expression regulator)